MLASDYVRNNIARATMEGASKSARQAVNALLTAAGSSTEPATIQTLWQPAELSANFRIERIDEQPYRAGQPNLFDVIPPSLQL